MSRCVSLLLVASQPIAVLVISRYTAVIVRDHLEAKLFHPSSRPAGHGATIGTPRLYDLSAALLFGGRRRSYNKLLAAAGVRLGDHILDIGCGPGYFARMLAKAVGPEGSVVGIDAAPEMIDYAGRKARRLSNCRFQSGTAESLAFPDAAFDVVVSSLMLHHLPDEVRHQAVREMRRVLRPGGRLLLADFTIPERGGWRLVASITGHAVMQRRVSPLEPLVAEADFTELRSGGCTAVASLRQGNEALACQQGYVGVRVETSCF